jgi:hypothetical protein
MKNPTPPGGEFYPPGIILSDRYDLFISYASENRNLVWHFIQVAYRAGIIRFWWDNLSIKVGESIPQEIDSGLLNSRYMVAFLTKEYFAKYWTKEELDSMRMQSKRILPIWVEVNSKDVKSFSPSIASRKALIYEDNMEWIVDQIASVLENDKGSAYFLLKEERQEKIAFWGMVWAYILWSLGLLSQTENRRLDGFRKNSSDNLPPWKKHIENELDISSRKIKELRENFPMLTDQESSLAILATLKRAGNYRWFPTYPEELEVLKKAGIDTW